MASANSGPFIPLKKAPDSKGVIAIANGREFWSQREKRPWLAKEHISLFLDQGRLVHDYLKILQYPPPNKGAEGVFFTKAEGIYEWQLLNPKVLRIDRFDQGHQATAILVLAGETAITPVTGKATEPPAQTISDIFRKLTISGFSNSGPVGTGVRFRIEPVRVSRFLEKGTVFAGDRDAALIIWDSGWVTVPQDRLRVLAEFIGPESLTNMVRMEKSQLRPVSGFATIDGVALLSNGWIIWWTLWDDAALKLRDPWGREQVLLLPPLAK